MNDRAKNEAPAGRERGGPDRAAGFTLIEVLIVVAVIGIVASIAIPQLHRAQRRAEFTAMITETTNFSKALLLYNRDVGQYPSDDVFVKTTLEPLVSQGYLDSNSLVSYLRDGEVHKYKLDLDKDKDLEWHAHPKMEPYDNGAQKIEIKGEGITLTFKYMGEVYDSSSILRFIQ